MSAEEIARGLTKAQRKAVLNARHDGQFWLVNAPWDMSDDLDEQGVTGEDGWTDALTSLGLEVRAILERTDNDE